MPGGQAVPNGGPGYPGHGRHEVPQPANPYASASPYPSAYPPANPYAQAGFEPNDPLARPTTATIPAASGPAITMASPPNGLLLAATVCAVIGGVIGALGWGQWWSLLGWVLAGPIAIWLVARFVAVDTERKTATVYSRPGSTGLWGVVALVAVVVGIAVTALAVGFWVGQL